MNRLTLRAASMLTCVLAASTAWAQTPDHQNKLLSKRAAEADAYRKLAEAVKGVEIASETYVRDFVTESDEIRAELDTFIKGVRLGEPRWYSDLSCEVPAEVTVAKLIQTLKSIHERHYKGDKITGKDIEQVTQRVERDVIKVVGMGAPRPDLPADLPEGVAEQLGGTSPPDPPIPGVWKDVPAQERLLAIRAARLDALRKLAEQIQGVRINSNTLVRDFVTEMDEIQATVQATVVGFTEKRIFLHHDELIAEVTIEVPTEKVITTIKKLHARQIQGGSVKGTDIEEVVRRIERQVFEATGMGVPRPPVIARIEATREVSYPDWSKAPITMEGQGVPPDDKTGTPQGKLLAARAAEQDAKRRLAEHIKGLTISSSTTVRDFVTEHDEIRSYMDAVLVGASVQKTSFDGDTATVLVTVPGMQVWEIVYERLRVTRLQ